MSFWQEKNRWKMLVNSNQAEKILKIWDFQIEKRSIWLWKYGFFLLWIEINKLQINKLTNLEQDLMNLCKKENTLFIQIETFDLNLRVENWEKNNNSALIKGTRGILKNDFQKNIDFKFFKSWYYKKFITPYTAIIDLEKSEEQILSEMKPKGRYNIRLAQKKNIKVDIVDKTDNNIKIFYDLMLETTSRDKFSWNTFSYYKNFLEFIDNSKLLIAYFEEKAIAAWIFIFDKEYSIYYYWASTNESNYRNLMAPYLLQWEAIREAKKIWSMYYDFLWVSSPWEKNSSLAWVTDFKLKLTKDVANVSNSYIRINNKILYKILRVFRFVKSKIT